MMCYKTKIKQIKDYTKDINRLKKANKQAFIKAMESFDYKPKICETLIK